jgi:hypothetical protein
MKFISTKDMKNEENTLSTAKNILFQAVPLRERIMNLLVTLDNIDLQRDTVKVCGALIVLAETQDKLTDNMEQNQENNKDVLRGLKNAFRMQEAALHKAMISTDEV